MDPVLIVLIITMSLLGAAEFFLVIISLVTLTFNNTALYTGLLTMFIFEHYFCFCYCGIRMMMNKGEKINNCLNGFCKCSEKTNGCMIFSFFCPVVSIAASCYIHSLEGLILLLNSPLFGAFRLLVLFSKMLRASGATTTEQVTIFTQNLAISSGIGSISILICFISYLTQLTSSANSLLAWFTLGISALNVFGFFIIFLLRANGFFVADSPQTVEPT